MGSCSQSVHNSQWVSGQDLPTPSPHEHAHEERLSLISVTPDLEGLAELSLGCGGVSHPSAQFLREPRVFRREKAHCHDVTILTVEHWGGGAQWGAPQASDSGTQYRTQSTPSRLSTTVPSPTRVIIYQETSKFLNHRASLSYQRAQRACWEQMLLNQHPSPWMPRFAAQGPAEMEGELGLALCLWKCIN